MKVRVAFTVDIDPVAWRLNYGVDRRKVNADVKTYIENGARQQLREVGVLVEGS
jgi:hypothetical protein